MSFVLQSHLAGGENLRHEFHVTHQLLVLLDPQQGFDCFCSKELEGGGDLVVFIMIHVGQQLENGDNHSAVD